MKNGMSIFGVSAIVAGQKSSSLDATPMLIVNSTKGKFTVTAPVTKALGIAAGENVMFANNIDGIEKALEAMTPDVVALAEENGIDINTAEGQKEFIAKFTQWYIAKGVVLLNPNGTAKQSAVRMTKEDKEAFIKAHGMELVADNREALLERLGVEEATDEELLAAISVDDINPTTDAMSGSKTATTSNATGVGLQLGFTDNNIWNQLKSDVAEDERVKINRKFTVDLENAFVGPFHNGKEVVDVKYVPFTFEADEEPIVRAKKD